MLSHAKGAVSASTADDPAFVFDGYLSAYAKNPTVGTVAYRQIHGQIPENLDSYDVLIAVPNCDLIGASGTLTVYQPRDPALPDDQPLIEQGTYSALVFDCAGRASHEWMIQNAIAAEVDFFFWRDNPHYVGTLAPVTVTIQAAAQ